MKKILFAGWLVFAISASAAASDGKTTIDPRVLSAFQKEFSFAENVIWETAGENTQVRFSMNDNSFIAWYSADAELISTARNILYMQLPLSVIKSLEEKYSNADMLSIMEVTKGNETTYLIQAEEKGKKLLLSANLYGSISVVRKIKK